MKHSIETQRSWQEDLKIKRNIKVFDFKEKLKEALNIASEIINDCLNRNSLN